MTPTTFNSTSLSSTRIIYTPSSFARSALMFLQEVGKLLAREGHESVKNEKLDSFLCFFVEDGSGELVYNGEEYALAAGDCVFIDCRYPHSHRCTSSSWQLRWLHFDGSAMEAIYAKYLERGGRVVFYPSSLDDYLTTWKAIYDAASSNDYIRDMRINGSLNSLLTFIMAESWQGDEKSGDKYAVMDELKGYLDEHYVEKISLDELSNRFFINKFYMTRCFNSRFGISINNYLIKLRITKAKHMLRFSEMSVSDIGLTCGIGDVYYFSRLFKKLEGLSPSEYRKSW